MAGEITCTVVQQAAIAGTLSSWLQIIYYVVFIVTGPFAIVQIMGYRREREGQIRDEASRAQRESQFKKKQSLAAARQYFTDFVALMDKYQDMLETQKLSPYTERIGDFSLESLTEEQKETANKKLLTGETHPVLNEIEHISALIISDLADPTLAYSMFGKSFCNNVEYLYDVIAGTRTKQYGWRHIHTVKLYNKWRGIE